jgi:hypothetical protein
MASFSLNLVQNSTIFISLESTFAVSQLALDKWQYVLKYLVIYTYISNNQLLLVFLLPFSVAIATLVSPC